MIYRVFITHCVSIISNIYGGDHPCYFTTDNRVYTEVRTLQEVEVINRIENYQRATFYEVKNLEKIAKK